MAEPPKGVKISWTDDMNRGLVAEVFFKRVFTKKNQLGGVEQAWEAVRENLMKINPITKVPVHASYQSQAHLITTRKVREHFAVLQAKNVKLKATQRANKSGNQPFDLQDEQLTAIALEQANAKEEAKFAKDENAEKQVGPCHLFVPPCTAPDPNDAALLPSKTRNRRRR